MVFTNTSTQPKSTPLVNMPTVMPMSSGGQAVNGVPAMMQFRSLSHYNKVRTCGTCGGR